MRKLVYKSGLQIRYNYKGAYIEHFSIPQMNDSVLLSKIRRRRRNFCSSRIAEVRFIEDYLSEGGCEHYKRELNNVLRR